MLGLLAGQPVELRDLLLRRLELVEKVVDLPSQSSKLHAPGDLQTPGVRLLRGQRLHLNEQLAQGSEYPSAQGQVESHPDGDDDAKNDEDVFRDGLCPLLVGQSGRLHLEHQRRLAIDVIEHRVAGDRVGVERGDRDGPGTGQRGERSLHLRRDLAAGEGNDRGTELDLVAQALDEGGGEQPSHDEGSPRRSLLVAPEYRPTCDEESPVRGAHDPGGRSARSPRFEQGAARPPESFRAAGTSAEVPFSRSNDLP